MLHNCRHIYEFSEQKLSLIKLRERKEGKFPRVAWHEGNFAADAEARAQNVMSSYFNENFMLIAMTIKFLNF